MNEMQASPWDNPRFRNWISVARAGHAVERAVAQMLAPHDLKPAHLDLMMNVYRHPGFSQQAIAQKLLVGRSNVTMLLPGLEKRDLVRREPDKADKRVLRLYLTDRGSALLAVLLKDYLVLIEKAMGESSPAECDLVGRTMDRVAKAMTPE